MRRFQLHRQTDITGVSGTGIVASGCQFDDGTCVVRWHGDRASTVIWATVEDALHVHGHAASTQVVWLDDADAAIAALNPASVWVIPKADADEGWLIKNPRRSQPGWHVESFSLDDDYGTAQDARDLAVQYLAAADEVDRRNAQQ